MEPDFLERDFEMMRTQFHFVFLLALAAPGVTAQVPSEPAKVLGLEVTGSQQASTSRPAAPAQAEEPAILAALVQEALQKNPAVQSASRQVQALRHRVPQAKTLPDPTVGVGWTGNIAPFSVQTGDPSSYRGITASQTLPYPGKLALQGKIADREDVVELAVVDLGPEVLVGCGADQLHVDVHRVAGLLHAALEQIGHAKALRDVPEISGPTFILLS